MDLGGIVCPTASTCYVDGFFQTAGPITNSGGIIITVTDGAPATPQIASAANAFYGLACWSADGCEAVGETGSDNTYYGVSAPISAGVPGTVTVDNDITSGFTSIDCPSAGSCDAIGFDATTSADSLVPITNGAQGTPQDFSSGTGGTEFACYDAASCLIIGGSDFQPFDNGTLGGAVAASGLGSSGSCPSSTECVTVGESGGGDGTANPIINGAAGTQTTDYDVEKLNGVVCSSDTSCLAVGTGSGGGAVVPLTVGSASDGSPGSTGTTTGSTGSTGSGAIKTPTARVTIGRVSQKNGVSTVSIGCSGARCKLTLTETARLRVRKHRKLKTITETVAKRTLALAANKSASESLTLDGAGHAALVKDGHLEVKLIVALDGETVSSSSVTLRRKK
jgi:hypothetical protein